MTVDPSSASVTQEADNAIRQEIQEFLPQFTFCEFIAVQKVIRYDLPRFREFKKQGE